MECEIWTQLVVGLLAFVFVIICVGLTWLRFNRPINHDGHVLDGKPVDIPVMDGETFTNNMEEVRRIQAKQER